MPTTSQIGEPANKTNDAHMLETFAETNEAIFIGMLETPVADDLSSRSLGFLSQSVDRLDSSEGLESSEAYKERLRPESVGTVFDLFMFENHAGRLVHKQHCR